MKPGIISSSTTLMTPYLPHDSREMFTAPKQSSDPEKKPQSEKLNQLKKLRFNQLENKY